MLMESNIILIGKTGSGKSATGNSVLQTTTFNSDRSPRRVTNKTTCAKSIVNGRNLYRVVDTPGLFGDPKEFFKTAIEIQKSVELLLQQSGQSAHVFLLVMSCLNRVTEEDKMTIDMLKVLFGDEVVRHTIVVFTCTTTCGLQNDKLAEFIRSDESFESLLQQFEGRVVGIDNVADSQGGSGIEELYNAITRLQMDQGPYRGDWKAHRKILQELVATKNTLPEDNWSKLYVAKNRVAGNRTWKPFGLLSGAAVGAGIAGAGIAVSAVFGFVLTKLR